MKPANSIKVTWKLLRLFSHLFSGIVQTLIFVRNGIHNDPRASRFFIKWNKNLCNIFRAHISVHGKIPDEPMLYVMNHISWFDIPVLASKQPLHFLSKAEIKSWPIIGWLAHRVGTLFITRGQHGAAQKSLEEITECLKSGGSVVVFPEGTTTDGHSVRKFHGRLLQAAINTGVKIQPVALRYPYKNSINPHVPYIDDMTFVDSVLGLTQSRPLCVELGFLEPIDDHLKNETTAKQLAQLAREKIIQHIGLED